MLPDVCLLYGLADNPNNLGKGRFTNLRNKSTKMPPQGEISCVDIFVEEVLKDFVQVYFLIISERNKVQSLPRRRTGKAF